MTFFTLEKQNSRIDEDGRVTVPLHLKYEETYVSTIIYTFGQKELLFLSVYLN